jgi:sugar phosphate permease
MVEKKSENKEKTSVLLKRIIVNRQAWATFLCHFGIVGSYVGFIGSWAVPYGTDVYHFSEANASKLILVGLIGALIGTFSSTWLSKKFNTVKGIYIPAHILAFAGWAMFFILGGKPSVPMLITLFLLIGFTNGANPLTFATIRNSFDLKEVGFVTGFANTGGFISAILLPIFFGKMLDSFQGANIISGYHYSFIIPIIFSFLGIIGGIMIKEKNKSLNN